MVHANKEQRTASVVCFHSHTRDKRPISVPEEARQTFTGVLQQITTTVMENGVFALVIKRSRFAIYYLSFNSALKRVGTDSIKVISLHHSILPHCPLLHLESGLFFRGYCTIQ